MNQTIMYSRNVEARAMSKSPNSAGMIISFLEYPDYLKDKVIRLRSINVKDSKPTSHLELQIPKEDIGKVIDALMKFV